MNIESDVPGGPAVAASNSLAACDRGHRLSYESHSECELARLNVHWLLWMGRIDMFECYRMQAAVRARQSELP
jgi:hypothetical protein